MSIAAVLELGCFFSERFYIPGEDGRGISTAEVAAIIRARGILRHILLFFDCRVLINDGKRTLVSIFEDLILAQAAAFLNDVVKATIAGDKGIASTTLDLDDVTRALDRHFAYPIFRERTVSGDRWPGGGCLNNRWEVLKVTALNENAPASYWFDFELGSDGDVVVEKCNGGYTEPELGTCQSAIQNAAILISM